MNVEIGTEAAQFSEKELVNGIFVAVATETSSLRTLKIMPRNLNEMLPFMNSASVQDSMKSWWATKLGLGKFLLSVCVYFRHFFPHSAFHTSPFFLLTLNHEAVLEFFYNQWGLGTE